MNHRVYLSLGSNMGDRRRLMDQAVENIEKQVGHIVCQSAFYETEPWGFSSPNKFLNAAVCVETPLCPRCLLEATQRIEREMGRGDKYGDDVRKTDVSAKTGQPRVYHDRSIDIDILLYDDLTVDEPDLKIPHPLMYERDFVMTPLREVMGKVKR